EMRVRRFVRVVTAGVLRGWRRSPATARGTASGGDGRVFSVEVVIIGFLPVGAPVAFVLAAVSVEHNHSVIPVPIGNVDFIGGWVHCHVGRATKILRVVAVMLRS